MRTRTTASAGRRIAADSAAKCQPWVGRQLKTLSRGEGRLTTTKGEYGYPKAAGSQQAEGHVLLLVLEVTGGHVGRIEYGSKVKNLMWYRRRGMRRGRGEQVEDSE